MAKTSRFNITDLTLASYLVMKGHTPELERRGTTPKGYPVGGWSFERTPGLEELVMEYNQGHALVEPRDFHSVLSSTRSKLMDFLGIEKVR